MGLSILGYYCEPQEHVNGRSIIGRGDDGDKQPLAYEEFDTVPGPTEPPDPIRSSAFDNYVTDTGVFAAGIQGSRHNGPVFFVNPYAKHGQRDYFNENTGNGKPSVIYDNRGRVLDGRTQAPGQQTFRYDTNIPRPAYMSFSDLLDQEGVYQ